MSKGLRVGSDMDRIQGLQKDLEKAPKIAKSERAKSKADTDDPSTSSNAGSVPASLPYPTTPEHGKSNLMPTAPNVVEDYDDTSTMTDQSPESFTSPRSYNKVARRPPARLDFQGSRSMNSEDFPAKSPLRSGTSLRSFQLDENRENIIRGDGTFTPMSPSLSVRMHQISRSSSPHTPQFPFPGGGSDEIDRVSVPRRERVRTPSQRSLSGVIPRDSSFSVGQARPEVRARSATLDRAAKQVRPLGFIETDVGAASATGCNADTSATVRSRTPDSVISDARIIESLRSPPSKDRMPHSDSGGTLADIAGTYYPHSSSTLPIAQSFNSDLIVPPSTEKTPLSTPKMDSSSSPESVYDDDADMSRIAAQASDLTLATLGLEPAAEFLQSPGKSVWLEHSPERPRKGSQVSNSVDSVAPSERSGLTTSSYEMPIRHVISPEILGSIHVHTLTCKPGSRIIIGVFRKDMLLIHKVEKAYAVIVDLAQSMGSNIGSGIPSQEDFEATPLSTLSSCKAVVDQWLAAVQAHLQGQPQSRAARTFCAFLSSDYLDETLNGPDPSRDTALMYNIPDTHHVSFRSATEMVGANPMAQGINPHKEGYLNKRGKNFGGWKAKYFVLDGPFLRYYESPGGSLVGSIKIPQSQVGRQQAPNERDSSDDDVKHAFLIMETKKRNANSYVRHVLCANSDADRDEWIRVLLHYVHVELGPAESSKADKRLAKEQQKESKRSNKTANVASPYGTPVAPSREISHGNEAFTAIGYDETIAGRQPLFNSQNQVMNSVKCASPDLDNQFVSISRPMNGAPIDNSGAWGATPMSSATSFPQSTLQPTTTGDKKAKKKSFWAFGKADNNTNTSIARDMASLRSPSYNDMSFNSVSSGGTVFGAPLTEAVQASTSRNLPTSAPIVLYRCIQYLDLKHAEKEEGIYRLSGSNTVIRGLKDRFNNEVDIDLAGNGEYFDVHAVAGLLKLYLRELPSSLLTRDLQRDFLDIIEMPEGPARMITVRTLVHSLPRENFDLLKLLSRHLRKIVDNSDVNKMTLRNVGIVFSPTLNIPAGVFSLFIAEYDVIFGPQPGVGGARLSPAVRSSEFGSDRVSSPLSSNQDDGFAEDDAPSSSSSSKGRPGNIAAAEIVLPRMEFSRYDGHGEV